MINLYTIYKVYHKYAEINIKNYFFRDFIQMDFAKFKARNFDKLNNAIWKIVRDYCYKHEFWIDYNFNPSKSRATIIL